MSAGSMQRLRWAGDRLAAAVARLQLGASSRAASPRHTGGVLARTSVGHLQVLQAGELQQGVQGAAAVSRLVHSQLQGRQLGARGKGLQVCSLQSRPPANKRIQSSILKSLSRFLLKNFPILKVFIRTVNPASCLCKAGRGFVALRLCNGNTNSCTGCSPPECSPCWRAA